MGLANTLNIKFVQEVFATKMALDGLDLYKTDKKNKVDENKNDMPKCDGGCGCDHNQSDSGSKIEPDVAIELGGEDAKILFLKGGLEVRMNGTCAGGTGSFIDQMASLLGIDIDKIDEYAKQAQKIYPIASRCGVFAKTDIQPLVNQGAKIQDLAKSILYAIVDQTIGGLAQGRKIEGNIVYLGGPLTFIPSLSACFDEILSLKGFVPDNSLYFVATGAALAGQNLCKIDDLIEKIKEKSNPVTYNTLAPLFKNETEYADFKQRHEKKHIQMQDLGEFLSDRRNQGVFLGVDSGSTTIKMVLIDKNGTLLHQQYSLNKGNPVDNVKNYLENLFLSHPSIKILGGCATGYGEELIAKAFNLNCGIVETAAHFLAAKQILPDVDFIVDIGGQDMKCLKIKNGAIDDIFLNEACSSGCGSFLQTFAFALGVDMHKFNDLAQNSDAPVDLGSRCTVFMNSSIKQAQKDGTSVQNIAAGLCYSVVKNALYKVIRTTDAGALGKNIVVQGGTFLSDAVLRAFEIEMNLTVTRPNIAGLMGAYGAALYALKYTKNISFDTDSIPIITQIDLKKFFYNSQNLTCGKCPNKCQIVKIEFSNNQKYLTGNKCSLIDEGQTDKAHKQLLKELNIFEYKLNRLSKYFYNQKNSNPNAKNGKIGLPFQLNMYEMIPFWHKFLSALDFDVVLSPVSDLATFRKGQADIPSDTVCFPAKLVHGHIKTLTDQFKVPVIFYPCLSYNINQDISNNHFNCPVVAYYPQVIGISNPNALFLQPFVDPNDKKSFCKTIEGELFKLKTDIKLPQIKRAFDLGMEELNGYLSDLKQKGEEIIKKARQNKIDIVMLVGRPYHADPEVNKGIPKLISGLGKAVVSEECVPLKKIETGVLNQWTYHARLYNAADFVTRNDDINLVQMVSFGCGLDAVTTDEVRAILEKSKKLYTQLKIDEITNLGAVKIRIKSLFAALDGKITAAD